MSRSDGRLSFGACSFNYNVSNLTFFKDSISVSTSSSFPFFGVVVDELDELGVESNGIVNGVVS